MLFVVPSFHVILHRAGEGVKRFVLGDTRPAGGRRRSRGRLSSCELDARRRPLYGELSFQGDSMHSRHLLIALALPILLFGRGQANPAERVTPNDNRTASGVMREGRLELRLDARLGMWHPDADDGAGALTPAFAADNAAPSIPGPLVRVRAGTTVHVMLRNSLRDTLRVQGFHDRTASPANDVPLVLAPGAAHEVTMRLDEPGTYFYWGTTTRRALSFRTLEDAQLTGAIVVDGANEPQTDRILVLGMWTDTVHRSGLHRKRVLAVINGKSWPHTERFDHTVGDTVRWRVINASGDLHPMHLHGFYFRVDARGDGQRDTVYAPSARPMAVTEMMGTGATVSLTWIPERAGNWLFHCHIPEHFSARGPLGMERPTGEHHDHAKEGMNGLVAGIRVREAPDVRSTTTTTAERHIRLLVREGTASTPDEPSFTYSLHEGGAEPPLPGRGIGPVLDVFRGEPVRIIVVNRLKESTSVHWHGIELESYFDGVPGFSGAGARLTPLIAPGDSFTVRFTPPRTGTFIYHTHADEVRQQYAGLAGALVVSERSRPRDPTRDIPLVISESRSADGTVSTLVNGSAAPQPLVLRAGTTYRLRLVQMAVARSALWAELWRDSVRAQWVPVAKDGADLPESARVNRVARFRFGIGETYDFEFTPDVAGPMRFEVRQGLPVGIPPLYVTMPITVLAAPSPRSP
jgi:FtsP/CotA-like multicopper oxidase with cupredoxin domain